MTSEKLSTYVDRVFFDEKEIQQRVKEIGQAITADYRESHDLLLIGILRGGSVFMTDLMKQIDLDLAIDFMCVSSYGRGTVSSGDVRIVKDIEESVVDRDVLIVEDIIDTGYTLSFLVQNLLARGARSVRVASMLNKAARRVADISIDYIGFDIPDEFVIGYGMDFDQKLRNLPFIGTLNPVFYRDNPGKEE